MTVFDGFKPHEDKRIVKSVVRACREKMLLSQYLAERFTYRTQQEWLQEIKESRFILNGIRLSGDEYIFAGAELVYEFCEQHEPECDLNYRILGIDENFICVGKSGNLPVHPAGKYYRNTLWFLLQREFGACAPVNRLDRETSGIVLFARNQSAARYFSNAAMEKKYRVIVHGEFPEMLDAKGFIMNDKASAIRKKRKFAYEPEAELLSETCHTFFRRMEYKNGLSLLEAELFTGRTHQIRASCCSLGYPVAGDKIYGLNEEFFLRYIEGSLSEADKKELLFERQALHAYSLSFKAPDNDRKLFFAMDFDLWHGKE